MPRNLTTVQLEAFTQFAAMEVGLPELRNALGDLFEFDFGEGVRKMEEHFATPTPGVLIQRRHIAHAMDMLQAGKIARQTMMEWATVLLLSNAFELDSSDEDFIAEHLNDLSWGVKLRTQNRQAKTS